MKLSGRLPKEHGLGVVAEAMLDQPHDRHVALVILDCSKITTDTDTDEAEPTARILNAEVIDPEDYQAGYRLMRRAIERRKHGPVLPLAVEDEISAVFGGYRIDPTTGEVLEAPTDDQEADK